MVICLERGADLHMAQLMPLPLTVSCYSKIQIGFTFLVPAHMGSPGKRAVKRVCVCVCVCLGLSISQHLPQLVAVSCKTRVTLRIFHGIVLLLVVVVVVVVVDYSLLTLMA